jgi:hypothetical protein
MPAGFLSFHTTDAKHLNFIKLKTEYKKMYQDSASKPS